MEREGKFKDNQTIKSFKPNQIPDENRSINSTKYDSLNNIIFPIAKSTSRHHSHSSNSKKNNFIQALRMIQGDKQLINHSRTHMSEVSETNANNSKEEKVINYLHNPITKNVTKEGNQLKVSFHKQFTTSINVPYKMNTVFETFLSNIVEIDDDEDDNNDEIIIPSMQEKRITKGSVYHYNQKITNKASTADYTDNNNNDNENESFTSPPFPEVKSFSLQIIEDLDELKEVNVSDYKNKTKKKFRGDNIDNDNEAIGTEIFIADSLMSSERYNHIRINRCLFSHSENKPCNKDNSQTEVIISLKQKTTEKKIPQKFYRRELVDSFVSNKSYKNEQENINTNLIDKFNKCDEDDDNDNKLNASLPIKGREREREGDQFSNAFIDSNKERDDVISINNLNNISIDAEMIDFITDNDSYISDNNKKHIGMNNPGANNNNKCFNELTPIRHHYLDDQEFNFKTPKDKMKRFKLPIAIANANEKVESTTTKEEDEGQTVYDLDFINNLLSRDSHYKAKANYINNHPKLKWNYRSTLIDWLMEISEEFAFKRDTFHYAINYIDRYLSKESNCEKKFLQLLGITSLGIAAKIEEVQIPKLIEYAKATDESYTDVEIIETEKKILKTLQWEIIPITLNTWMNWYICQWDLFLDTFDEMVSKLAKAYANENVVYFKRPDDKAYYNYRKMAQVIDLCALTEGSLSYDSRSLVACGILIVLMLNYDSALIDVMTSEQLDNDFFYSLLQNSKEYIGVYREFIKQSFNFEWNDSELIHSMIHVGRFIKYNFKYDVPLVYQISNAEIENVSEYSVI